MFYLRELERNDISTINVWRNNPELISFLGASYRYINIDVDMNWYDAYIKNRSNTVRCAIVNDDTLIGLVTLADINSINRSCAFHIMIGESKHQGKGAGFFATKEMLKHAFYNLNLHRVELGVLESNTRAQQLYKKVGFKTEGKKRSAIYKNGKYEDLYIMSILKEEFNEK